MIRLLAALMLTATAVSAQTENVEVEPVTCWWRTTAAAVRVGEPFDVVLTCSFLQTEAATVVADESRLDPSVVQLQPFEVIGGSRADDLATATRRFVQFDYRLRVVAENVFATEVALPPLEITYRIESRVAGGDTLAGRDLPYALPSLTMRVLSLVPDTATDIREAPVARFADIEDAGFRGTMLRAVAAIVVALGALIVALAVAGALRQRRAARPERGRVLSDAAILQGVRRELSGIQDQTRASGWTADLAGRALAALRIVAAYVSGRPVAQASAGNASPADGQLVFNGRRGGPTLVSAAVTVPEDDELRDALARFTAVRYGRDGIFDAHLDDALDAAIRRIDRLAAERPLLERLWAR